MSAAAQDFEAALHEAESNLDVRRLMIVVVNVLVPAAGPRSRPRHSACRRGRCSARPSCQCC